MNESVKPIVFFRSCLYPPRLGDRADLLDVTNHPRLGNYHWVSTSAVQDIREDGRVIETLNTIYIRKEE